VYLASSLTTFEHHPYSYLLRSGQVVTDAFTDRFTGGLRTRPSFTGLNRKLYGHGI